MVITINAKIPLQSASSYSNTATIITSAGTTETNPASNSATVSTSVTLLTGDLTATVSPTATTAWALGAPVTYTFTYTNNGPDDIPAASINTEFSPVNNPLVIPSAINTICMPNGGAVCPVFSATGFPYGSASIPAGSSLVFTSTFTPITYIGSCVNTAGGTTTITLKGTINPATGITDTNMSNNSASTSATTPINNPICPPVVITGSKTEPASFTFGNEKLHDGIGKYLYRFC